MTARVAMLVAAAGLILALTPLRASAGGLRIVTLSPHAAELVAAAGGLDRLVGVAAFTDRPVAAASLPVIGDSRGLDRERIVALQPDLAIAWKGGNRPADLDWLAARGIRIYASQPRRLDDIPREIREIGDLIGTGAVAAPAAQELEARIETMRDSYRDAERKRYFFQLWRQPPMTFGGDSLVTRALAECAAENVFDGVRRENFHPDPESLLNASPAIEIIPLEFGDATPLTRAPVKLRIDPGPLYRPGPGFVDAVSALCKRLQSTGSSPPVR